MSNSQKGLWRGPLSPLVHLANNWISLIGVILITTATILWLFLLVFKTRVYALKVQDRVIRLEERLRLAALLPAALQPRIGDLSVDQLIGLRFASDAELPGLVEKTLGGNLNRKQIKELIKNWKPDTWRV